MEKIIAIIAAIFGLTFGPSPTPIPTATPMPTPTPAPPITYRIVGSTESARILLPNDEVSTSAKMVGLVDFANGTVVRLAPKTAIKIQNSDAIVHTLGSLYVRFTKLLGAREQFSVETPTALATVRGSAFASIIPKFYVTDDQIEIKEGTGSAKILTASDSAKIKLTPEEKVWVDFNVTVDRNPESIATAAAQTVLKPTSTPAPTRPPLPTAKPIAPLSSMPGEGYSRGLVKSEKGDYTLSCIGASRSNTRVITDSGNESDCKNDCTVLPLHEYASRNSGFAAMNGTYFCPADYPQCAEKKNSFDTLFFNSRSKRYLNSDNNVYSVLPFLVINGDGTPRFNTRALEWGRDTGIQAGIAGNPMLVQGTNVVVPEGSLDQKQRTVKTPRGAFVQKGDNIYLCTVSGATVIDSAYVYKALGVDNAMNIDGGGSTAMWHNGRYIFGPGRSIPNAIIFARK